MFLYDGKEMLFPNKRRLFGSKYMSFAFSKPGAYLQAFNIRRTLWKYADSRHDECLPDEEGQPDLIRCITGQVEKEANCTLPIVGHDPKIGNCTTRYDYDRPIIPA